jgi:hypothetical protein
MLVERLPRSEQFTTAGGRVVPERIVPGGLEVNGVAILAAILVVLAVAGDY